MLPATVQTSFRLGRLVCGVLLGAGLLWAPTGALAQTQPLTTSAQPASWALTLNQATLYSGPSEDAVVFGNIPPSSTLQVLGYQGDWAHIYNPRTSTEAYVASDQLAPGDAPSRYVTMSRPALTDEFDVRGIVTDGTPLAVYPTPADEATDGQLNPNTWLNLTGAVNGEDGARWYRTNTGDFVSADAVFIPERTEDFTGHWLDVNLNSPARVSAFEGDTEVTSFLAIKGTGTRPTPTGVFTILRRVANETMNSDTIGIPRFGPGGYYLTGVLFTQYFTGDGRQLPLQLLEQCLGLPRQPRLLGPDLWR